MLSREEAARLLDRLCANLGFCLSRERYAGIVDDPPDAVPAFVDAVFEAEGLDPATADRRLWRQVRDVVAEAFAKAYE